MRRDIKLTMEPQINIMLHQLDCYRDAACHACGGTYPDVVLNLEAVIHHHQEPRCLDLKTCRRRKRRQKHKGFRKK